PPPPPRVHHPPVHRPAPPPAAAEAHTAPHDEIVGVARDLIEASDRESVTIDALANALKGRGFRRTPGSPRLITRLRRIKELEISRNGLISLAAGGSHGAPPAEREPRPETLPEETLAEGPAEVEEAESEVASADAGTAPAQAEGEAAPARRSRRRGRRGGRRHRRRAPEAAAAE
ncbi:MAG: hypothetical protein ACREM3_30280, partial [Candidatus Rokuibacteriota bacterium]